MSRFETGAGERETGASVDLSGRVALVTGAARRTGAALARSLARAGADVAVHCQTSREEAQGVVDEIAALGRRSRLVVCDLRDAEATRAAFSEAAHALGRLDVLVNNVGTIRWKPFDEHTANDWDACLGGTLFVTLHATRAALPAMRAQRHGRIVNILDVDADSSKPVPYATAYKIGKRATWQLTKTVAEHEAPHGITCNAVSPGSLEDSEEHPPLDRMPSGRYGRYADVAEAVLFCASDGAEYITGAHLKVSGGYLI